MSNITNDKWEEMQEEIRIENSTAENYEKVIPKVTKREEANKLSIKNCFE